MKNIIICLILLLFLSQDAFAYVQSDLQWKTIDSKTLKITGFIKGEGYEVRVMDFPSPARSVTDPINGTIHPDRTIVPSVILRIYKGSELVDEFGLGKGDYRIINDDIKVIAEDLPAPDSIDWIYESYNPWVLLTLQGIEKPNFDIKIIMNKSWFSYNGDHAELSAEITNNGGTDADNVDITIDTKGLKLTKGLQKESFSHLIKDESITVNYGMDIPGIDQQSKTYDIYINVSGHDIKGNIVNNMRRRIITVGSDMSPNEAVSLTKSSKDIVYLGDNFIVSLMIVNNGKYDINPVTIEDYISNDFEIINNSNGFELTDNSNVRKTVTMGSMWTDSYTLRAKKPGRYTLPAARIDFDAYGNTYNISSDTVTIKVLGPDVIITKNGRVIDNNTIRVLFSIRNTGTGSTTVMIKDELPDNSIIVRGSNELSAFIDKYQGKAISYDIRVSSDTEKVYLPSATAYYSVVDRQYALQTNNATINNTFIIPKVETIDNSNFIMNAPNNTSVPTPIITPVATPTKKSDIDYEKYISDYKIYIILIIAIVLSVSVHLYMKRRKHD